MLFHNPAVILFKPYSHIHDFLQRFTLLKIGQLHVRLHKLTDKDRTNLFHSHPFHYLSVVLRGGNEERFICGKTQKTKFARHGRFSFISRNGNVLHRIEEVQKDTITLFFAFGNFGWRAVNPKQDNSRDGVYHRNVLGKILWSKRENEIWFMGHPTKEAAEKEYRHSIHQI